MKRDPGDWGEETAFEVRSHDTDLPLEEYARLPKFPVHLVLDNLRSAFNVGSIFRTADTARIASILTCGYTAHPPHARLEKTALGTLDYVQSTHFDSALDAVADLKSRGVAVFERVRRLKFQSRLNSLLNHPLNHPKDHSTLFVRKEQ